MKYIDLANAILWTIIFIMFCFGLETWKVAIGYSLFMTSVWFIRESIDGFRK